MPKRKSENRAKPMMYNKDEDGRAAQPSLPKTPAQKRYRRASDVIDSMGESGQSSSPSATQSASSGFGATSQFDSPFSSCASASPASASSLYATTPSRLCQGTPAGFVTPKRLQSAHWNGGPTNSPDLGYSTPEYTRFGAFGLDHSEQKIESHDALGPTTDGVLYQYPSEVSGKMSVPKDADRYNMNHRHRGKCVIFNNERFDTGFEIREGSSVDAHRIKQTFQRLGFAVEVCHDFEYSSVMQKISELSQEDHSERDCLCIFVLTHGLKNNVICSKDAAYSIEKLWKPFTAERCITLAGKPKLFFVQACRGDSLDEGVRMCRSKIDETDSLDSYKIPTHADFLFANSTAEGFYSWRNPVDGTWYIQSLCEILDEFSATMDLSRMLTMTARKVATDFASYNNIDPTLHDLKQVPMVSSTLIRDLFFTPKNG